MNFHLTDPAPISILPSNESQLSISAADQTLSNIVDCSLTAANSTHSSPLNTLEPQTFAPQTECLQDNVSVLIVDDNDINLKVSIHFPKSKQHRALGFLILLLKFSKLTVVI